MLFPPASLLLCFGLGFLQIQIAKKGQKLGIRYDDSDKKSLVLKIIEPGVFYVPRNGRIRWVWFSKAFWGGWTDGLLGGFSFFGGSKGERKPVGWTAHRIMG